MNNANYEKSGRRAFLQNGTLLLTAAATADHSIWFSDNDEVALRIGLITDLHYADKPPAGSRFYRESLDKLAEAAKRFSETKLDFVVDLGDLIDAADSVEVEQGYLETVNRDFSALSKDRHYVLGNHCVDMLTKQEFLVAVEQERSWYSFDRGEFHFVVLDSCFRSDGEPYGRKNFVWTDANIPHDELEWLRKDLQETAMPVIVFAHQRLDVSTDHGVKNCVDVRSTLEANGKVLAVFQGHSHQNDLNEINGIPYCTLVAMVEGSGETNSGYSTLEIEPNGTLRLTGFRNQNNHEWPR